jgi:small subunit ribosomal protein S8
MSIDSVGNFLTVIRNALKVYKRSVAVPFSGLNFEIARVLKEEGFVKDFQKIELENNKAQLVVQLKYVDGESVIHELVRVSTPGRRNYSGARAIKPVIGGLGISILTTNAGVISDKQARKSSVGGELLCYVW